MTTVRTISRLQYVLYDWYYSAVRTVGLYSTYYE